MSDRQITQHGDGAAAISEDPTETTKAVPASPHRQLC